MFAPFWRSQESANTTKADALLERFLLIKKREDFAGSLSGGQRKLLEMARALMADPELVMLDEPMAGVNPALKQSLLGHVKSLRDEGRTVLFVEHDMDMVRDISDWVIVMAQGKVIAEGPPHSVMGDQRVIDAYLGSHHDQDLSAGHGGGDPRRGPGRDRARSTGEEPPATVDRGRAPWLSPTPPTPDESRRQERRAHLKAAEGAVLRADDLIAGYLPGVNILNGADLYCQENELVGIIGPNGAGKSTLLKALFGLVKINSGTVQAQGRRHHQPPGRPPGDRGHRLRAADQQRVPVADHPGEPGDGRLPAPEVLQEALRVRRRPVPGAAGPQGAARRLALRR